jgi:glycosyltransferase involved in cell wall biosynthesis
VTFHQEPGAIARRRARSSSCAERSVRLSPVHSPGHPDVIEPVASVVIATRDRPSDLPRVLAALTTQETDRAFEVVIVDDGSSPPLAGGLISTLPGARLIRGPGHGPAQARNIGISAARAPVILFTDDDTEPAPGWIEAAYSFLVEHPDHVGVEGPVRSPPFDPLYQHSRESERPGSYFTCNIAYRRDVLVKIGGFLELFPDPHCEDLDLAYRAVGLGPIGFAQGMVVTHYPRPLSLRNLIRRGRFSGSEVLLFSRHRERFGRVARIPPRMFPASSALFGWFTQLRREGPRLLRSPRRLVRFLTAAIGYVLTATVMGLSAKLPDEELLDELPAARSSDGAAPLDGG